jgi:tetratricopeptide (TPR) repeat protein
MFYDWNWTAAERDMKQGLLLNPNSATVHLYYSWFLIFTAQYDQAIAESIRALELDPLSSLANTVLGYEYLINREYDKAIEKLQWTLTIYPKYFMACYFLGHAFRGKSMINEAIEEYEKAASFSGDNPMVMSWLACAYFETGRKEQAEKVIINLQKRMKHAYVPSTSFVPYYIISGDLDQAYWWLEKAVDEHDSFIIWRLVLPVEIWQFPKEPKFRMLLKKVGLEKFTP